jgi:8-oxo-dGTP pyrophosphatase MutT (NUDIX family)
MREWLVAGALVEVDDALLLVRNERRGGYSDWSTPGGVIDAEDPSVLDGLTREVYEETELRVTAWEGPVYEVQAVAVDLGWRLRVEVYRALRFEGELHVADPDGIVVEAAFLDRPSCADRLADGAPWVREPLAEWLDERWGPTEARGYAYDVRGTRRDELSVRRSPTGAA